MDKPEIYRSVPSRTAPELREEFERLGLSIAEWARTRGFSPPLVYQILAGRKRCARGKSHEIALALGLKVGRIGSLSDIGAPRVADRTESKPPTPAGADAAIEGDKT